MSRTRRAAVPVAAVLAAPVVAGAGLVVSWAAMSASAARRSPGLDRLPEVDAVVVLGAQMHPGGEPSAYLQGRLDLALEVWRTGKASMVIVSGDDSAGSNHESTAMAHYLAGRGVPADRIVIDPDGVDTYSSCRRARDVYRCGSVVVVSQSFHLPRALFICWVLGLPAWGVGDRSVMGVNGGREWRWGVVREIGAQVKMAADLVTGGTALGGDVLSGSRGNRPWGMRPRTGRGSPSGRR